MAKHQQKKQDPIALDIRKEEFRAKCEEAEAAALDAVQTLASMPGLPEEFRTMFSGGIPDCFRMKKKAGAGPS